MRQVLTWVESLGGALDSDFNLYSERADQVGAYIEGVASHNHDSTDKSPTWVDIYTRGYQGAQPARRMRISSSSIRVVNDLDIESGRIRNLGTSHVIMNGDGFRIERPIILGSNIIQNADRENTIVTNADQGVEIVGALKLTGNVIQASDGGTTITLDTSDNVTIGGDLTVAGGDIIGPVDGALSIRADGNIALHLDDDADGTNNLRVLNGADGIVFSVMEADGATSVGGTLQVSGNAIKDSGGTDVFNFDGTGAITSDNRWRSTGATDKPIIYLESRDTSDGDSAELRFEKYDSTVNDQSHQGRIRFYSGEVCRNV